MDKINIKSIKLRRVIGKLNSEMIIFRNLKSDCIKNQRFEKAFEYRDREKHLIYRIEKLWKENGKN